MSAAENKTPPPNRKVKVGAADVQATPPEQLDDAPATADGSIGEASPSRTTEAPETQPAQTLSYDQSHAGSAAQEAAAPRIRRPRIRWGAIVWGLIVGTIAVVTLAITRTTEGREGFVLWLTRLTPGGIWLIVVLAVGGILLLLGLLSAIRRLQRR